MEGIKAPMKDIFMKNTEIAPTINNCKYLSELTQIYSHDLTHMWTLMDKINS